jgi:hypothetical protein
MIKKPLVVGSQGQLQQLQAGDSISTIPQFSATNGDAGPHAPGTVVYISSGTTVRAAQANSYTTVRAQAVATEAVPSGAQGLYQYEGVASGSLGLSPGSTYFLSPTSAGQMTTTPPSTVGDWIMVVGQAFSATELSIELGQPIEL